MSVTTLTSKGQLTLPKDIRDRLGLKPGDRFSCSVSDQGAVLLQRKTGRLEDLIGILHVPGRKATVEEMNEAIAAAAASRHQDSSDAE